MTEAVLDGYLTWMVGPGVAICPGPFVPGQIEI
jgi:hypothetical protein